MAVTRRVLLACGGGIIGSAGMAAGLLTSAQLPARAAETDTMVLLMDPGPLPDIFLGSVDAPVTIIEYASLSCTHCAQFAISTYLYLKSKYIDGGKVRYTMRQFPIDEYAAVGAMLARSSDRAFGSS
jgi:protein-disulfide isomerase